MEINPRRRIVKVPGIACRALERVVSVTVLIAERTGVCRFANPLSLDVKELKLTTKNE